MSLSDFFGKPNTASAENAPFRVQNNPSNIYDFEYKGGRETIYAFIRLSRRYDNLQLLIRSWVPSDMKRMCKGYENIKIIDGYIDKVAMGKLYSSSHIFLRPGHQTLGPATLEAMSYGLCVIANRIYNVPEAVQDGKTGLLIEPPPIQYYTKNLTPNDFSWRFSQGIKAFRDYMVEQTYDKMRTLVENSRLRRQIGTCAKKEVEDGEFSIRKRNDKLRGIIEEACSFSTA